MVFLDDPDSVADILEKLIKDSQVRSNKSNLVLVDSSKSILLSLPVYHVLDTVYRRKLSLVGHIIREEGGLSRTLLLGAVYDPRGRGQRKTSFIDKITKACGGIHAIMQQAKDRRFCRQFAREATVIQNLVNRSR